MQILKIFLSCIIIIAVIYDVRSYTIPNSLILLSYALAFLCRVRLGWLGIAGFFAGALLPIVSLILLQRAGVIGGGDIKLLSAAGGFLGIRRGMLCVLISFFFGAVLSLVSLLRHKNGRTRIDFFLNYVQTVVRTGKLTPYYQPAENGYSGTIHFSIAVMLAVWSVLWLL